tara:strand:- start:4522 stop:4743 length:222 start_codon:yes stop_codon:yes gene_type:complete
MSLKESKLNFPNVETFFICWNNERTEITSYGSVLPSQCMETFWNEVDFYIDELIWLEILLENGINNELNENEN